ncbi:LamG domain-containing protein [Aquipseudomonas alcaligenes]|uniref:Putative phage tail protein n=1 Tax=Aquipseudomonas alcaligenes TaxID=43263 RepID=A0A1N6NDX5_AQUAC|nr:LamG domain-containing protein [Pseudomonas alcaligenes]SIP90318.1 Putative phage tail protein [Pseudomonas alcaligenes]
MSSGGKSVKVGYRYFFGIHMLVSRGEVDELVEIKVGGKSAWRGSVTGNASVQINAPELFGGDDGEGGIQGRLDVMMGGPTQSVNAALASMLGGLVPAFRGMFTLFYDGLVTSMNPYPKPWTFRVRRALKGWDGPVWYPEKAVITLTDPETGGAIKAMNPAHILYELETNHDWGRGKDRSRLDDAAFRAAADQLYSEGLGLCLRWVRTDSIDSFAGSVLDHIAGNLFTSRNTGLRKLTLVRSDYVVDNLPHFTPDSGLLEIQEDDNSAGADAANEVVVTWRNPIDNSKRPARERNLAAIRAAGGRVISVATEYIGLPTYDLAARIAKRDLRAKVSAKRWKLVLDRRGRDIEPGAAFRFSAPARGLSNIVVRAGRADDGTLEKGAITITAVLDVFGMPATTFSAPPPSGWVPPNSVPQAVTTRALAEVTWRDLVQSMDAANLQLLDASTCFLGVLAARPTGLSLGYHIQTRVGTAAFETRAGGDFCPTAVLVAAVPQAAGAVTVGLSAGVDLDVVRIGSAALVDSEVMRVDALDLVAMTATFARGCVDSVPSAHVAGARVWFFDDFSGVDPTEYTSGTTVEARLLTNTASGLLDPVLATNSSLTLSGRSGRPYPPGLFRIGGVAYPASVTGSVSVSWAHRDRLLQADQVVDTAQSSIGPEPGTTYSCRMLRADNSAELVSYTGITGTSQMLAPAYTGDVIVELWSVRGGLSSLQRHSWRFGYINQVVASLLHFDGVDGSTAISDQNGRVWTRFGNAQIDTDQFKFGGSSLLLDGSGDYLTTPHDDLLNPNGAFTVECWFRAASITTSTPRYIARKGAVGDGYLSGWILGNRVVSGQVVPFCQIGTGGGEVLLSGSTPVTVGTWVHLAATHDGATLRLFVNGALQGSGTGTPAANTSPVTIGQDPNTPVTRDWHGWIDEFRFTKGVALYTSSFTPPVAAFPNP